MNIQQEVNQMVASNAVKEFKITDYFKFSDLYYSGFRENKRTVLLKNDSTYIQSSEGSDSKDIYFILINFEGKWKIQGISKQKPEV